MDSLLLLSVLVCGFLFGILSSITGLGVYALRQQKKLQAQQRSAVESMSAIYSQTLQEIWRDKREEMQ